MVEPIAVVVQSRLDVEVLRREAMAEDAGERAALRNRATEGVVDIGGNGYTIGIDITRDVAVVVVARNIDRAIHHEVEQPGDAACALERAGEVLAPVVVNRRSSAIRVGNMFFDEIPVVVEEGRRRFGRGLADTAGSAVIVIRGEQHAVRGNGDEAVRRVVGVCANTIRKHVPVHIVCWLTQRRRDRRAFLYHRVLIELVGGVDFGCKIKRGTQQIPNLVVGVRLRVLRASA